MKKYLKVIIPILIVLAIVGGGFYAFYQLSQNGTLNMADVYATLEKVSVYMIPAALLLVAIIIALIIFRKKDKKFKFWLRAESFVAMLVAIAITANVIVFGPLNSIFNLNYAQLGTISAETLEENGDLTNQIADEGTVLLKNTDNFLPLSEETKNLNVFGWASTNPVYGGTGSGNVDTASAVNLLMGLENGGYNLNTDLSDFYTDYRSDRPEVAMWAQDWTLPEPAVNEYSEDLLTEAQAFSDTAVVVIGRVGGEGADLPKDMTAEGITYEGNEGDFTEGQHFLELSKSERDMMDMVTSNFDDVVVVINSANSLELGFLEDYDNIKGALWMAGPGATGFNALGSILNGSVNPSGKTVNTYVYDLKETPSWNNFGAFQYEDSNYTFVNYVEGIYVGYKFYETYYQNEDEYNESVQYPFGYGLSYTDFTQEMSELTVSNSQISFDVTVTNTGDNAGKEVVQAYFTPPYTNGGIEKADTNLVAFEKTDMIEPGATETVTITFDQEDMASFDSQDSQFYILEEGQYDIQIKSDAHTVLDEQVYTQDQRLVYEGENKRPSDEVPATNQFDYVAGEVDYLSRANDFANYQEATAVPESRPLTEMESDGLMDATNYELEEQDVEMPTTGADNGKELADYIGVDYDDESWNELLDQLTVEEMHDLISYGGYQTLSLDSVGKVHTYDFDGPAAFSSFFVPIKATAFPTAVIIAATWNKDLALERGEAVGTEANQLGIAGWYGPAMNIHRSAFSGRNFEYYSEDSLISGKMAAQEIAGAKSKGVYSYMKHFALNDQETNRLGLLLTWSNEQAMREIYLKPFELAVKEGGASAAMSSFNYIGNKWVGANGDLLNTVLRDEWGFRGVVSTDYFGGYGFMDADMAIRNGNDIMLSTTGESGAGLDDTESPTAVNAMRKAAHNTLYTVVNSSAYADGEDTEVELLPWQKTVINIDIAAGLAIVLIQGVLVLWYFKRFKKE